MATASPITTALFWSKVEIPENRVDCWRWKETINGNGYGRYWVRPHWIAAHRFSYEQFKGAIPEGLQVRHLCHNRLCCNPDHLDVGTAKENARDSIDAGRFTKGSTNGNSKLTEADVIHIRKNPDRLRSFELAKQFQVSTGTISNIKSGKIWRHVSA